MRVLLKLAFVFFFFFDENFNDDDDDENECVCFCDVLYSRINSSKELKNISLSLSLTLTLSLSKVPRQKRLYYFLPLRGSGRLFRGLRSSLLRLLRGCFFVFNFLNHRVDDGFVQRVRAVQAFPHDGNFYVF